MVAGGDGTVMWVISEMTKTGIDARRVAVGHIPFGTGNDFSRSTGWGPMAAVNLIGENYEFLRKDLWKWMTADVTDFDVWEVEVAAEGGFSFCHAQGDEGLIGEVKNRKGLTSADLLLHGITKMPDGSWRMRKSMVNYFSLGSTCRAGLGFEKKRTTSRHGNFARYAIEGVKKLSSQPAPLVSDLMDELSVGPESSADGADRMLTVSAISEKPTAELLFLNVPSFAAGAQPWAWSSSKKEELQCRQDVGDGRLEVVSYGRSISAAIDAANAKLWVPGRGCGERLASSAGPFVADFKPP
jgi:diacylglycerol kinase (ATP)